MPSRSSLSWKAIPRAQPKPRYRAMTSSSSVASRAPGLDRRRDQGGGLAADHVEVQLDRHQVVRSRCSRCRCTGPRTARRHVSSYRRIRRRTFASGNPRSVSRWRAIRDRLNSVSPVLIAWGTPWTAHRVGAVAALPFAVLDVVVDEAEVVAELDGRGTRERAPMVAGDRGVGEQAEQRPDALAARGPGPVEREVVADHLVQAVGRRVAIAARGGRSRLGVGDEGRRGRCRRDAVVIVRAVYTKRVRRR